MSIIAKMQTLRLLFWGIAIYFAIPVFAIDIERCRVLLDQTPLNRSQEDSPEKSIVSKALDGSKKSQKELNESLRHFNNSELTALVEKFESIEELNEKTTTEYQSKMAELSSQKKRARSENNNSHLLSIDGEMKSLVKTQLARSKEFEAAKINTLNELATHRNKMSLADQEHLDTILNARSEYYKSFRRSLANHSQNKAYQPSGKIFKDVLQHAPEDKKTAQENAALATIFESLEKNKNFTPDQKLSSEIESAIKKLRPDLRQNLQKFLLENFHTFADKDVPGKSPRENAQLLLQACDDPGLHIQKFIDEGSTPQEAYGRYIEETRSLIPVGDGIGTFQARDIMDRVLEIQEQIKKDPSHKEVILSGSSLQGLGKRGEGLHAKGAENFSIEESNPHDIQIRVGKDSAFLETVNKSFSTHLDPSDFRTSRTTALATKQLAGLSDQQSRAQLAARSPPPKRGAETANETLLSFVSPTTISDFPIQGKAIDALTGNVYLPNSGYSKLKIDSIPETKILYGRIINDSKGSKLIGGHSASVLNSKKFTVSSVIENPDGTLTAAIQKRTGQRSWSESTTKTLFPKSWTDQKIIAATRDIVGTTKPEFAHIDGNSLFYSKVIDGINVEVVADFDGNILAAYPRQGQTPSWVVKHNTDRKRLLDIKISAPTHKGPKLGEYASPKDRAAHALKIISNRRRAASEEPLKLPKSKTLIFSQAHEAARKNGRDPGTTILKENGLTDADIQSLIDHGVIALPAAPSPNK